MPFPGVYPPPLACETRAADVHLEVSQSLEAGARGDPGATYAALARAERALGCLREPMSAEQVGRLYLAEALVTYLSRDEDGAREFLRGAADLGVWPSEELLNRHSKLRQLSDQVRSNPRSTMTTLLPPEGVSLSVDGAQATTRPVDRPYLLQVRWEDGEVRWSGLLPPDQPPTLALLAPPPAPPPLEVPTCPEPTCPPLPARGPAPALTLGAITTTALSAGLYGLSANLRVRYLETPPGEPTEGLVRANAATAYAALGVGALALGLDVAVIVQSLKDGRER